MPGTRATRAHEIDDPVANRGLAAGQPDLANAEIARTRETICFDLLERQHRAARLELHASGPFASVSGMQYEQR